MPMLGIRIQRVLFLVVVSFIGCVPKPEPSLLGVIALPLVTQTSDRFFVESTTPTQNQTNVPVATNLQFTFSQTVNTSTISGNLEWSPSNAISQFTVTPNNRLIQLTPNVSFSNATQYTVRFKKEIQSSLGVNMEADFDLVFTTE